MKTVNLLLIVLGIVLPFLSFAQLDANISVNVKDSSVKNVLELIAAKAGLNLVLDRDPNVNVSLAQSGLTARQLLEKISTDQQLEYSITGNQLIVRRRSIGVAGTSSAGGSHLIPLRFALASEMVSKLSPVMEKDDRILADDHANSLIFIGSKDGLKRVQDLVTLFDAAPKQIMIEAVIVATSHSFLRDIGISIGDTSDPTLKNDSKITGFTSTSMPTSPSAAFKAILGHIDGRALDLRLTAAESKGNAKVVSRPKIVTLNNRAAKLQSGVTLNVKTLSNVSAASTSGSINTGVVTGSITSIDAALSLNILPLLVGDDQIQMIVDINDASPDLTSTIDGIPGVLKNSASTAVIVKNGQTAVIAGLVKQSNAKNTTGVPFLSDIPILGNLFKSTSISDHNNELVIFLTPTIDDTAGVTIDPALLRPEVIERKTLTENEQETRTPASAPEETSVH